METEDFTGNERIDENIDTMLEILEEFNTDIDNLKPLNVPQQAAKDRMKEILDGAFYAYMTEFVQCNQIFEQGTGD